jgi:hypothetical protein
VIFQAARKSFLHSRLLLETINLATDLLRFVQEHLSINPAALCRREISFGQGIELVALPQTPTEGLRCLPP